MAFVLSLAMEPPVCDPTDGGVFSGFGFPDGFDTPVVYIPKGTINKYKDTSPDFVTQKTRIL